MVRNKERKTYSEQLILDNKCKSSQLNKRLRKPITTIPLLYLSLPTLLRLVDKIVRRRGKYRPPRRRDPNPRWLLR